MRKRIIGLVATASLIVATAGNATGISAGEQGTEDAQQSGCAILEKDEVVYARLSQTGGVDDIYIVNHLSLSSAGVFTDNGAYSSAANLTDLNPLKLEGAVVIAYTDSRDFYYQGNLSSGNLPWRYEIAYFLDGSPIAADALAGSSGKLEIRLSASADLSVSEVFRNNYMQQITFTLSSEKCSGISAKGATIANAGKNKIIVFTVLPKQDAAITVSADVRNFEMPGIEITAMPFSMSFTIPDIDEMLGEFKQLTDALIELDDGVSKLESGTMELAEGSVELSNGSSGFADGLALLSSNSRQITDGSASVMSALTQISSALSADALDGFDISGLARLPFMLNLLSTGIAQVSGSMEELRDAYTVAYASLDEAILALPGARVTDAELASLYSKSDAGEQALLSRLMETQAAAFSVKSAYEQVKPVLRSVPGLLDSAASTLNSFSQTLALINEQITAATAGDGDGFIEQFSLLAGGLAELSGKYAAFHNGLTVFMQGLSELKEGYSLLDEGIAGLSEGACEISSGISQLSGGTSLLVDETADIPDLVKHEIDKLMSDYSGEPFDPVSFVSPGFCNVTFVQFVFRTGGIELPKAEKSPPQESSGQTLWNRLTALFE